MSSPPHSFGRWPVEQQLWLLRYLAGGLVLWLLWNEFASHPWPVVATTAGLALAWWFGVRGPLLRLLLGIGLLAYAGLVSPMAAISNGRGWTLDMLLGLVGFALAFNAIGPIARAMTSEGRLRDRASRPVHTEFEQASLPRRIYFLLLTIAEADGRAGSAERELVRRFLLQRFASPLQAADLRTWEAEALPRTDIATLAAHIAVHLAVRERITLFYWCCLVALADGSFRASEHDALQRAAAGLGLRKEQARIQFLLAKERMLRHGPKDVPDDPDAGPRTARERAYATLGLPYDARPDAVRRRHRELVKQLHPDALPNLGPIAQQEASERFREVQRAYETLMAS